MSTALTKGGEASSPAIRPARRRNAVLAAIATFALVLSPVLAAPALAEEPVPSAVVPPGDAVLVGDLSAGKELSIQSSPWAPAEVQLTYEWWTAPQAYVEGGENPGAEQIADADAATLILAADSVGDFVWAKVTGSAPGHDDATLVAPGDGAIAAATFDPIPEVSITGTAKVGQTLNAVLSAALPPTADPVAYQWKRDGVDIADATQQTYVLQPADLDRSISVTARYTAPGYVSESRTSDPVVVGIGALATAPIPALSGSVRVDSIVSIKKGAWPEGTTFTYRWRLTDSKNKTTVISGATAETYKPTSSTRGRKLSVQVTGTAPGYSAVTKTSALSTIGYGVFATAPAPKISGSAYVGATLKVTAGTWSPSATLAYQWKRNGSTIKSATKTSYKLTSSDYGKKITVTVTAKRTSYSTKSVTSSSTATVTKPFSKVYTPTISGTTRVGQTIKANVKAWSPTASFTYQWKRNGVVIPGATKSTYKLTPTDLGTKITVTVVGKRAGYFTRTLTSSATGSIGAPAVMTTAGLYRVGIDVAPGTYVATGGSSCWFERRSNDQVGSDDGLLGVQYAQWEDGTVFAGQKVITIATTDAYFYTVGCGTFRPVTKSLKSSIKDGTWVVGKDVSPGTWKLKGPIGGSVNGCDIYFLSSFTGDPDVDLIEGFSVDTVGQLIEIWPSDKGFISFGCGTWVRVGN